MSRLSETTDVIAGTVALVCLYALPWVLIFLLIGAFL